METRPVVPQNGGNGPPTVKTGVLLIGRGVAYRNTEETDLCWSATVETGVLFNHPSTGYCSSSPPPPTVQPALSLGPVQPPLHGLLFIQPSTGYCSTSPPRGPVHPPPTGLIGVLFIQRQRLYYHRVLFIRPQRELYIQPPTMLTVHQGKEVVGFDRLQLAAVAKQ